MSRFLYWNILSIVFFLLPISSMAQQNAINVIGKVVAGQTQQAVEFATVMAGDNQTKSPITGTTTDTDGNFNLEVNTTDFYIEISFIGFSTKTISEFDIQDGKINLGTILLLEDSHVLNEVEVRAEKSSTEFKLDKRVFNVGKDLSSTGASALEVLNNVPSVNVNIEGEISLRGSSGVQVLINGKPSVLASEQGNALGTITADMIQQIEVITNPSAKYDAEGTSGIINIVIKKEERKGINGSVSLNTGIPHNHSFGLSLNRRTEKFNLFSQLGAGYRELPHYTENNNEDYTTGNRQLSEGIEYRNEVFYNIILGTDYHINDNNVLTLSGFFALELEDQPSQTDFQKFDGSDNLITEWYREETTEAVNPKYSYELNYKSEIKGDEDHTLLFSAIGNLFAKDQSSEFFNTTTFGDVLFGDQQTATNFKEIKSTFKLDYAKPINDYFTLETGAQYLINDVSNDYEVIDKVNNDWEPNAGLTNIFEYTQNVLGIYGTAAYENDIWGIKGGLRMEQTDLQTMLLNTNENNDQKFTNLFPSFHSSYKFNERFSLQAGYSRRIFRPRLWDLNPFFNIRNNISIRTGNPNLLPEYTDSYEITSIYILDKISLNFGVYYRYTTDVKERISTFVDGINYTRPFNIGTNRATGLEFNFKYSPSKKVTFNGDVNYNYFNREGSFEGQNFDFQADQLSGKLRTKLKLPKDIDAEITGHYNSPFQTVQGRTAQNIFADLGVRKKILKGKGVLNFSVRDIFASRVREGETIQPNFYVYSRRQRGRFITLGFSYGFGKGEAMEFSGGRRR